MSNGFAIRSLLDMLVAMTLVSFSAACQGSILSAASRSIRSAMKSETAF